MRLGIAFTAGVCLLVLGLVFFLTNADRDGVPDVESVEVSVTQGEVTVRSNSGDGARTLHANGRLVVGADGASSQPSADPALDGAALAAGASALAASQTESGSQTADGAENEIYEIKGLVRGEDGYPIDNAKISAALQGDEESNAAWTVTDMYGQYSILLESAGVYKVHSVPEMFYHDASEEAVLSATEKIVTKDFTHKPTGLFIRGKVFNDETTEPIPNADVSVLCYSQNPRREPIHVRTNANGGFSAGGLVEGGYSIEAKAKGYVQQRTMGDDPQTYRKGFELNEKTQTEERILKLMPGRAAKIRVFDSKSQPIQGASVEVRTDYYTRAADEKHVTDGRGESTFLELPKGRLVARASKASYGQGISEAFQAASPENPVVVDVVLTDAASVSGQVTYKSGTPVTVCRINVVNEMISQRLGTPGYMTTAATAYVDSGGNYLIEDLGAGAYTLWYYIPEAGALSDRSPENLEHHKWNDAGCNTVELKGGEKLTGIDCQIGRSGRMQ